MNIIVIIHTIQAFLLCILLLNRRFRSLPNIFLMAILAGIVIFNILNSLILNDIVTEKERLIFSTLYLLPPPLIYTYWYTYIYGKLPQKQLVIRHLIPILIFLIVTVSIALSGKAIKISLLITGEITVLYHVVYPILMLILLKTFYGNEKQSFSKVLKYNSEKTSILKIFMFMMIFHSLIIFMQYNSPLILSTFKDLHTYIKIQIFFMITLQYLITWVIVTMPVVIHFSDKRVGLATFKKYKSSSLSSDEAKLIAKKLNNYMDSSEAYKNPLYSVQDLSRDVGINYIDIAETLNGLLGQSFNDYVNNYRIEEVKRLFTVPDYKKESILSIAFESGFNSKAAFYSSFKKFTGETPSQCRDRLQPDL